MTTQLTLGVSVKKITKEDYEARLKMLQEQTENKEQKKDECANEADQD